MTLRLVRAVVVEPPPPRTSVQVDDYQRRQDETVQALLMVLGLKEVPDVDRRADGPTEA